MKNTEKKKPEKLSIILKHHNKAKLLRYCSSYYCSNSNDSRRITDVVNLMIDSITEIPDMFRPTLVAILENEILNAFYYSD